MYIEDNPANLDLVARVLESTGRYPRDRGARRQGRARPPWPRAAGAGAARPRRPAINGFEIAAGAQHAGAVADPIAVVTANILAGERRPRSTRCESFIEKPFDIHELRREVARLVQGTRSTPPPEVVCPNCRAQNADDARFCGACGLPSRQRAGPAAYFRCRCRRRGGVTGGSRWPDRSHGRGRSGVVSSSARAEWHRVSRGAESPSAGSSRSRSSTHAGDGPRAHPALQRGGRGRGAAPRTRKRSRCSTSARRHGLLFIAMELVKGTSLRDVIRTRARSRHCGPSTSPSRWRPRWPTRTRTGSSTAISSRTTWSFRARRAEGRGPVLGFRASPSCATTGHPDRGNAARTRGAASRDPA